MILEDRGLTPAQMQSVIGISENLIQQYRGLYAELDVPEYRQTLERLKRTVFHRSSEYVGGEEQGNEIASAEGGEKGGAR